MVRQMKISRANWPGPCRIYPGTEEPCGYLLCSERDLPLFESGKLRCQVAMVQRPHSEGIKMVDVCWLIHPAKCGEHGPGRTCKTDRGCWYKTEEAKKLLKQLHGFPQEVSA